MAQSVVDCCNSALQKLGAGRIMALTDNSVEARECNNAFEGNRRAELRKHRWNFAIKRVVLSPDATAPAFDYTYQFTLPSDCLRPLLPRDARNDWVIEGRKILTNDGATLQLRYIADITDMTQWDPACYDMLVNKLAIVMCEKLTNSTGKKGELKDDYKEARAEARKNNAFEQLPAEPPDDDYWLARL